MADVNKRITFTGVDDGVDSMMARLRSSAEKTTKDLIRQAREYSTSGKEVVGYIEDEIRAIERRNSLYQRERSLQLQSRKEADLGRAQSPEARSAARQTYTQAKGEQKIEIQQDQMQIDLMRELIETVKGTAKEEIRADQKNVEQEIESDKKLEQLGIDSDQEETEALKRTLQRQYIGDKSEEEAEEKRKFDMRKVAGGANQAMKVGTMANEIFMMGSILAMIPFVGEGLSDIFNKLMNKGEELENAENQVKAQTGRAIGPVAGYDKFAGTHREAAQNIGLSMSDYYGSIYAPVTRAMGGMATGAEQNSASLQTAYLMKGLNMDVGTASGFAHLTRGTSLGVDQQSQQLIKAMQAGGLMGSTNKNAADFPEWASIQIELGKAQLIRLGEIDTGVNTKLTGALASSADIFKNPAARAQVLNTLDQGMRSPSSSAAQAMQFAVLRQQNPGASRWELRKLQEEGIQDEDQLQGILGRLKSASGTNDELFFEQISAMFPQLSLRQVEGLGGAFNQGKTDLSTFASTINQQSGIDMSARAQGATGVLERRTADWDNWFADAGKTMNTYIDNKIKRFGEVTDAFSDGLLDGVMKLAEFNNSLHLMDQQPFANMPTGPFAGPGSLPSNP